MAHSISAEKRIRQNAKHRMANKMAMSAMKTRIKKFIAVAATGDAEKAKAEFLKTVKSVDRAAKAGRLHPNNAARKKSSLTRLLNATLKKIS
jgi:small subunit ribosomal protein S20